MNAYTCHLPATAFCARGLVFTQRAHTLQELVYTGTIQADVGHVLDLTKCEVRITNISGMPGVVQK